MGEKKEIEFVKGDGKGLNISPAEDHINDMVKIKKEKKENIVIPKGKNDKKPEIVIPKAKSESEKK